MNDKKLAGWASSSVKPEEVSNRVKGIVLALSSIIIFMFANLFQINLNANDIVDVANILGLVAGATWTLWGAGIMLVKKFAEVKK